MDNKWLFLFIVHAGNKYMRTEATKLLDDINSIKKQREHTILVLLSEKNSLFDGATIPGVNKHDVVLWNMTGDKELVKNFGDINVGNYGNLKNIFKYVDSNFKFDRLLMYASDHGSGFGIFAEDPDDTSFFQFVNLKNIFGKANPPLIKDDSAEKFKEVKDDPNDPQRVYTISKSIETDALTGNELNKAIKDGFGGKPVNVLLIMSCFMQLYDTGYALKENVKYLVAAETVNIIIGYNYTAIINAIFDDPSITDEHVARLSTLTLEDYFKNKGFEKYLKEVVISVLDLKASSHLKTRIDAIANQLIEIFDDAKDKIIICRKECIDLSTNWGGYTSDFGKRNYIDINKFIQLLFASGLISRENFEHFNDACKQYIVERYVGGNYQHQDDPSTYKAFGISIFLPKNKSDFGKDSYYDTFYADESKTQTLFAKESKWKNFIDSLK